MISTPQSKYHSQTIKSQKQNENLESSMRKTTNQTGSSQANFSLGAID